MMFGIPPENHSVRVAKSHQVHVVLAIVMKTIAQLVRHASTTTKHQLVHRALAAMMQRQVAPVVTKHHPAHHVHIEMKPQVVHAAMILIAVHRALVVTKHHPVRRASTTMTHQFAHHALSAMKFMHLSRACHARKLQLNA
jgi:hypothetical protein